MKNARSSLKIICWHFCFLEQAGLRVTEFSIRVSKGIWSLFEHCENNNKISRLCALQLNQQEQLKHNAGMSSHSFKLTLLVYNDWVLFQIHVCTVKQWDMQRRGK